MTMTVRLWSPLIIVISVLCGWPTQMWGQETGIGPVELPNGFPGKVLPDLASQIGTPLLLVIYDDSDRLAMMADEKARLYPLYRFSGGTREQFLKHFQKHYSGYSARFENEVLVVSDDAFMKIGIVAAYFKHPMVELGDKLTTGKLLKALGKITRSKPFSGQLQAAYLTVNFGISSLGHYFHYPPRRMVNYKKQIQIDQRISVRDALIAMLANTREMFVCYIIPAKANKPWRMLANHTTWSAERRTLTDEQLLDHVDPKMDVGLAYCNSSCAMIDDAWKEIVIRVRSKPQLIEKIRERKIIANSLLAKEGAYIERVTQNIGHDIRFAPLILQDALDVAKQTDFSDEQNNRVLLNMLGFLGEMANSLALTQTERLEWMDQLRQANPAHKKLNLGQFTEFVNEYVLSNQARYIDAQKAALNSSQSIEKSVEQGQADSAPVAQ